MSIVLDSMYETMSISTGLYPNLDLWNANKLRTLLSHDIVTLDIQLLVDISVSRIISHSVTTVSTSLSSFSLWPPRFYFNAANGKKLVVNE